MNIASTTFLLFGLIVAVAYNLAKPVVWRKAVLVMANIAFLLSFSLVFSTWIPYLFFLILGYIGYLLARTRRNLAYIPILFAVLTLYFWLKKYTFFPEGMFLRSLYVSLGLSYVLFRVLHLLIDTYEGEIDEFIGPVTFFNYTMNFTSIVSGPIQLYKDYAASQSTAQRPDWIFLISDSRRNESCSDTQSQPVGVLLQELSRAGPNESGQHLRRTLLATCSNFCDGGRLLSALPLL